MDSEQPPPAVHGGQTFEDAIAFAALLPRSARLIGVDPGTRTFGLALSDLSRLIASPLETIRRTKFDADAARLLDLAAAHRAAGFVVGLPAHLDGGEGRRAQSARAFARNVNRLSPLPVLLWDERFSTAAAERVLLEAGASRKRRAEAIDKVAAAVILQGALDRMKHLAGSREG